MHKIQIKINNNQYRLIGLVIYTSLFTIPGSK